jgi:hypothetical protein
MSVQKKFLMSRGKAISAWQAADFLLFLQIMISANINVYHIRVLLFYSFIFINIVSNKMLYFHLLLSTYEIKNSSRSPFFYDRFNALYKFKGIILAAPTLRN